ncbi:MAG: aspartate aminotransferase family protein [Candidatus Tectimicrobiota bacterium]|nr:MAG: aspartate aminotransferase family protein [Candidatus Tectomicrobia bacterium]
MEPEDLKLSTATTEELLALAREHLFRYQEAFTAPLIARAQGATLWDRDGREYLDFSSGQMCATIGHNHPRILEALRQSGERVIHLNSHLISEEVVLLAKKLADLLPEPLKKTLLLSTGGESTEVALKLAKMYTGKWEVVGIARAYHGHTGGAMAVTFLPRRAGFGPWQAGAYAIPAPYCYRCPLGLTFPQCQYACLDVGFELIDAQSVGALAACIAEPILSGGGIIEPPPGYFPELKRRCQERGMLFISDEAQTGLGRLGAMFAFEQDGIVPDILALSKTLGAGVPLAATVTSRAVEEVVVARGFGFLSSHMSDPLPAAVGLAVLEVLEKEDLVGAARAKGEYLKSQLLELQARHPLIGDVRGRGLLLGVEFVRDPVRKTPAEAEALALTQRCLEKGLVVQVASHRGVHTVWRLAPPLTITYEEIDRGVAIIDEALSEVMA